MDRAFSSTDGASSEQRFAAYARLRDVASLEDVLRDHLDQAYASACRILGNRTDAEDAVQEALTRLVKTAETYDPAIPFAAWLGQLVRQASIEVQRSRRRRVARERVFSNRDVSASEPGDGGDRVEILRRAIRELPEHYREPLELHYFSGLSQQETGRVLGLREEAVAQRLSRARQRIRQRLDREGLAGVAVPMLLSDACRQAAGIPGPTPFHLVASAHASAASATSTTTSWLMVAGIAMVTATAITIAVHATAPSALPPSEAVVMPLPPMIAPPSRYHWSFDHADDRRGLTVMNGTWEHVDSGSFDGSGYMKIDQPDFALAIDLSSVHLPLLLSFRSRSGGGSAFLCAQWNSDRSAAASFAGVGRLEPPGGDWSLIRIYIDERTLDHWINGHRYGLLTMQHVSGMPLKVVMRNQIAIDDLRIDPIARTEIPDMGPFLSVYDAIPPAERHGRVRVESHGLPGVTASAIYVLFADAYGATANLP